MKVPHSTFIAYNILRYLMITDLNFITRKTLLTELAEWTLLYAFNAKYVFTTGNLIVYIKRLKTNLAALFVIIYCAIITKLS